MWNVLGLLALGAGAYALWHKRGRGAPPESKAAFAPDQGTGRVRDAGPAAMRDPDRAGWSAVDEASDQSFPASDPPGHY